MATTTYIAIVEDDTLYNKNHFDCFRPPLDAFAYNMHRWSLFTWGAHEYSWKNNQAGCACIAPRKLMIEALEERFAKYPDEEHYPQKFLGEVGRNQYEKALGLTEWPAIEVYSKTSCIQLSHPRGLDKLQRTKHKNPGEIKAIEIPFWGKATDIAKEYK